MFKRKLTNTTRGNENGIFKTAIQKLYEKAD